ncbi:MAG: hypothetical protein JOZ15_11060 [Acidobacteria bacterium]|nr:hypothetical protein [Acidobacteriota bacterium]
MLPQYVALVSETGNVDYPALAPVAGAIQKQVTRDFEPIWGINAVIAAYPTLEDVPLGYWPVIIKDDIGQPGAAGIHLDDNHQPFSLVQFSNHWSLTASHECLEMLADPYGNRVVASDSIKQGQGRVEYLVEVCDPSEAEAYAYTVNAVQVSDFYTPRYFDPVASQGVQYSFTGKITEPRQVLPGGYLSWHDPTDDHWYQARYFTQRVRIVDLGVFDAGVKSLRAEMDKRSFRREWVANFPAKSSALVAARAAETRTEPAKRSKAAAWRAQIAALTAEANATGAKRSR